MVKITVIKRNEFQSLINKYSYENMTACQEFSDGQEFLLKNIDSIPDGFCSWAWADIQRDVAMVEFGATPEPKLKKPQAIISCCTDGLRPVIFLIEKV